MWDVMTNRLPEVKNRGLLPRSHDQALVGDKTLVIPADGQRRCITDMDRASENYR